MHQTHSLMRETDKELPKKWCAGGVRHKVLQKPREAYFLGSQFPKGGESGEVGKGTVGRGTASAEPGSMGCWPSRALSHSGPPSELQRFFATVMTPPAVCIHTSPWPLHIFSPRHHLPRVHAPPVTIPLLP